MDMLGHIHWEPTKTVRELKHRMHKSLRKLGLFSLEKRRLPHELSGLYTVTITVRSCRDDGGRLFSEVQSKRTRCKRQTGKLKI